jgi:hypothetical protein
MTTIGIAPLRIAVTPWAKGQQWAEGIDHGYQSRLGKREAPICRKLYPKIATPPQILSHLSKDELDVLILS